MRKQQKEINELKEDKKLSTDEQMKASYDGKNYRDSFSKAIDDMYSGSLVASGICSKRYCDECTAPKKPWYKRIFN